MRLSKSIILPKSYMKALYILLFSLCQGMVGFGQDVIYLKNGNQINASVIELTPTMVKFTKIADGPVYTLNVSDLTSITYKNGAIDSFVSNGTNNNGEKTSKKSKNDDDFLIPIKKYSGPRVGLTYLAEGTNRSKIADAFNRADITPAISQFGWQFETRIFTLDNGAAGLVEFIPMIGGIEQGLFLPSATGLIGFRAANGIEFGVGPTASLSGVGLVLAAGASFKAGKVTFPVNLAFTPNIKTMLKDKWVYNSTTGMNELVPGTTSNSGFRLSLLIGFNSRKE
jgi:hypothetical protein